MQRHEAEALATKLTRIWLISFKDEPGALSFGWALDGGDFGFEMACGDFALTSDDGDYELDCRKREKIQGDGRRRGTRYIKTGCIYSSEEEGCAQVGVGCANESAHESQVEFDAFAAKWLNVFRRNLFLCGIPVECTEHEGLEWHLWLEEQEPRDE